ncbi:MAG: hypothetical protein JJU06_12190 [Ectothiorhodospiraceae bacterium]|nr:hypothetical protein [Ectothiorhodospiraceae bacterium]MCH8503184.1 hypothetical protein [Ectothiorhodospiraceae bacterium]
MQDRREARHPDGATPTPVRLDLIRVEADMLRSQAVAEVAQLIGRGMSRLFHRPASA